MATARFNATQPDGIDIEERIRRLGTRHVLEVPKMLEFHKWLDDQRSSRSSCCVVGESYTGKTVGCKTYALKSNVDRATGEPPICPVIYWHCPGGLTAIGLLTSLLRSLHCQSIPARVHHSQVIRGYLNELRERLYQSLQTCQVEMIVFDEAHRLSLNVLSVIRDISAYLQIAVVLVGTDRLNILLDKDEKNSHHFLSSYRFNRLNAEELQEMTELWEEHVLQMPEPSKLTSAKAQNMLFPATQGLIGLLDRILIDTAARAIQQGQSHIGLELLKQAIVECS
jgi:DNA transposition AAA+ family ATPase